MTSNIFNPLTHKLPYGASAVGKPILFTFPVYKHQNINRVLLILQKDDSILEFELQRTKTSQNAKLDISNDCDIFESEITLANFGIWHYRFEGILDGGHKTFFGKGHLSNAEQQDWLPNWQLTVSKCDYKTPVWAKSGVTYQIFADRFCRVGDSDFQKDGVYHNDWQEQMLAPIEGFDYKADDFFGGNIKGVVSKLDYLKSLGVTLIYFTPIFKSGSNHRYDTGDYMHIDELFGTDTEFAGLVQLAKSKGINIMLDGVFNHTGSDSIYFNKKSSYNSVGAYNSTESPYYDWYYFQDHPDTYSCWWGSTVVPTVNKSAKGFNDLLFASDGVISKWTKMGIKGWRFDVVDELPIDFTTKLCRSIKDIDNDVLLVGEVWEDASTKVSYSEWRPYFMGEQLDSVMNYPVKDAILSLMANADVASFKADVMSILENYPKESLDTLMNLVGTHDTARILTVLSGVSGNMSKADKLNFRLSKEQYEYAKQRLMTVAVLQYVLPGVPCVYYGDEAGQQGFEDPFNRDTYPWGQEDAELLQHYQNLGKMREMYADVLQGEMLFDVDNSNPSLLALSRSTDSKKMRAYVNFGDDTRLDVVGQDMITGCSVNCPVLAKGEYLVVLMQ